MIDFTTLTLLLEELQEKYKTEIDNFTNPDREQNLDKHYEHIPFDENGKQNLSMWDTSHIKLDE